MKKYKTTGYGKEITIVEIERETEKSVWIKGRREMKWSSWHKYHDTWEDARAHLLQRFEANLRNAKQAVERCSEIVEMLTNLEAPQ